MTELHLRRHMAINPHKFDLEHSRWAAPLRAAAAARFRADRDQVGRFTNKGTA